MVEVIHISEASKAIGATKKSLEHWCHKYEVGDDVAHPEDRRKWRTFGIGAVAVLSLTNVLVKAGFDAPFAYQMCKGIVRERYPELFEGAAVFKVVGNGCEMLELREGTWAWDIDQVGGNPTGATTMSEALLVLNAAGIIEQAFGRLRRKHKNVPIRVNVVGKKKR
jgi:hypothetical protein